MQISAATGTYGMRFPEEVGWKTLRYIAMFIIIITAKAELLLLALIKFQVILKKDHSIQPYTAFFASVFHESL